MAQDKLLLVHRQLKHFYFQYLRIESLNRELSDIKEKNVGLSVEFSQFFNEIKYIIYCIKLQLLLEAELNEKNDQLDIELKEKGNCKESLKTHVKLINNLNEQNKIIKLKYGEGEYLKKNIFPLHHSFLFHKLYGVRGQALAPKNE